MTGLGKTPWVDRNLRSAWDRIAEQVPESWMPQRIPGKKFMIEELGCGYYGCVAPVPEEGMVFKITSDVTEAQFVAMDLDMDKPEGIPEGIVQYYKIFALGGSARHKRPLFVLWRQDAKDIGFLRMPSGDPYQRKIFEETRELITTYLIWARDVRDKMERLLKKSPRPAVLRAVWEAFENADVEADPWRYKGVPHVGMALRKCWDLAMTLANTDIIYPVGSAILFYLNEGVLLADVHLNNIGRDVETNQPLITDPGHAVVFHPQWEDMPGVPEI